MDSYFIVNGKDGSENTNSALELLESKGKVYQYNDFSKAEKDEIDFLKSFIKDQFGVSFKTFPQIIYVECVDDEVMPTYVGGYSNLEKYLS